MSVLFTDIEVAHEYFFAGFKRQHDGLRTGMEMSRRKPNLDRDRLRKILLGNTIVTFNGQGYDFPLLWYAVEGATNAQLKRASDQIINDRVKYWEIERLLQREMPDFRLPRRVDHIDIIEPQPNAIAGLKTLNGRLHGTRLQDLPFDPDARLTDEQMDESNDYCLTSDLDATENLFDALKEPLELRVALGEEYGEDFRSKSDSQIGETIVKSRIQALTGKRPEKVPTPSGTTFRYPIPPFMKFETPILQQMVERLRETDFVVKDDGKVDLPKWLSDTKINLGTSTYAMGIGGLHSTESNRAVRSDEDFALIDADVASMYPAIILMLGLYPKALGKHFLAVYRRIKDDRIAAKTRAKEIKALLKTLSAGNDPVRKALDVELLACNVKDKGLKIALNGVFGKLGSRYSILYAPHLLLSTTLTGQLTLLMLIERAVRAGIDVVSGNTDGVLFKCPHDWFDGITKDRLNPCVLSEITEQWERDTGFDLEFAEYRAVYSQSVNSYFAIKADGGHKRKGPLGNPWSRHTDDFDPRAQLMKNPQTTICSDAALAKIKFDTPIEETIRACQDIRQFVSVVKVDGGATWRGGYLGKVVRFYYSTDGEEILRARPHKTTGNFAKVPKTDGSAPCMTLPTGLPNDLDYERYFQETREILMNLGYDNRPAPPPKPIRITKANRFHVLSTWALAA